MTERGGEIVLLKDEKIPGCVRAAAPGVPTNRRLFVSAFCIRGFNVLCFRWHLQSSATPPALEPRRPRATNNSVFRACSPDPYRTALERNGFKVRFVAVLRIELSPVGPPDKFGGEVSDSDPVLDGLVRTPELFAGLIFTSQNGVRAFAAAAGRQAAEQAGDLSNGSDGSDLKQRLDPPDLVAGWRETAIYALGFATARACTEVPLKLCPAAFLEQPQPVVAHARGYAFELRRARKDVSRRPCKGLRLLVLIKEFAS